MIVLKLVYENDIEVASDIIRFKNKLEEKNIIIGLIERTENNSNVLEVITKDDSSKEEIKTILEVEKDHTTLHKNGRYNSSNNNRNNPTTKDLTEKFPIDRF